MAESDEHHVHQRAAGAPIHHRHVQAEGAQLRVSGVQDARWAGRDGGRRHTRHPPAVGRVGGQHDRGRLRLGGLGAGDGKRGQPQQVADGRQEGAPRRRGAKRRHGGRVRRGGGAPQGGPVGGEHHHQHLVQRLTHAKAGAVDAPPAGTRPVDGAALFRRA